jgi:hypothetical protein
MELPDGVGSGETTDSGEGPAEYLREHPLLYWLSVAGAAGGMLALAARAATATSTRKRVENVALAAVTGGELLGLLRLKYGRRR